MNSRGLLAWSSSVLGAEHEVTGRSQDPCATETE